MTTTETAKPKPKPKPKWDSIEMVLASSLSAPAVPLFYVSAYVDEDAGGKIETYHQPVVAIRVAIVERFCKRLPPDMYSFGHDGLTRDELLENGWEAEGREERFTPLLLIEGRLELYDRDNDAGNEVTEVCIEADLEETKRRLEPMAIAYAKRCHTR
jgi:hypothetical protein